MHAASPRGQRPLAADGLAGRLACLRPTRPILTGSATTGGRGGCGERARGICPIRAERAKLLELVETHGGRDWALIASELSPYRTAFQWYVHVGRA